MDLEATEAELERQNQDLAWQQATQPPATATMPARELPAPYASPPRAAYNMAAAAAYRLEDISDTSDPKTDEGLHEVRRLLHVALEK